MKTKLSLFNKAALLGLFVAITPQLSSVFAQNTAFTYQGRLNDGAGAANGTYDFTFTIFDLPTGNGAFAVQTNLATPVTNGLFLATLDWGAAGIAIFSGPERWLEISVRTNGSGAYAKLTPRQKITPTPYAFYADNVGAGGLLAGIYGNAITFSNSANSFNGTYTGNGASLSNVNAVTLGGLAASNFWRLDGNNVSGTPFLGTTDSQPLTLSVSGTTAMQYVPGVTLPNVVGGLAAFRPTVIAAGVSGAVVGGGAAPSGAVSGFGGGDFHAVFDNDGTIGGGFGNKVGSNDGDPTDAAFATVGGGVFNTAGGYAATVGGGDGNQALGVRSVVAGGTGNLAIADYGNISGGIANTIQSNAIMCSIGGGSNNLILSNCYVATISGGSQNICQFPFSTIGGGGGNAAIAFYATVAGGNSNTASAYYSTVGGGYRNFSGDTAFVGDGNQNSASGLLSTVGGGDLNIASGQNSTIAGGEGGQNSGDYSTIGGGGAHIVTGGYATVPGGFYNTAAGLYSFAAGQRARANHQGSFVWADSLAFTDFTSVTNDTFNVRSRGGVYFSTSGAGVMVDGQTVALRGGGNTFSGFQTFNGGIAINSSNGFSQSSTGTFTVDAPFNAGGRLAVLTNGNVGIGTNNPSSKLFVVGNIVASGSISPGSDRNSKEHFSSIDPHEILDKVAALPITRWNYIADGGVLHLGPMAQDFYAAFNVGIDDKHISTVDADGVALAAIQGLNQKLEERTSKLESELKRRDAENEDLKQRLAALEQIVRNQKSN